MLSAGDVLECSWGALGSVWGASGWGRVGEVLGSSRVALWSVLGCFRAASGKLWGAFASSEGASPVEKLKMLDSLYLLSESKLFEVPEAHK